MTMYIFYDLETTGTDVVFDQILQFGAILADENLVEQDRFECRCRLLPWVVPAAGALLVTATDVRVLDDPALPDFYTMMLSIAEKLRRWGPATFIGYNSMRFDEPFLQRGFWQALLPPYHTVTGGNARLDLLPLIRASSCFRPNIIAIARGDDGAASFRLDALAPANGFNAHNAHDAIGDVEATIYLARKLKAGFPELWGPVTSRASKAASAALLQSGAPLFLFHHSAEPPALCYQPIDRGAGRQSHAILARLGFDWAGAGAPSPDNMASIRKALRRISLNKAPLLFTMAEIETIAGIFPSADELVQARFLAGDAQYCQGLADLIEPFASGPPAEDAQVEELIFNGFPDARDERLMVDFHAASPEDKSAIAHLFSDSRFRRLALRILFVQAPQALREREREIIEFGIVRRLQGDSDGRQRWRSINEATGELDALPELSRTKETQKIAEWLTNRTPLTD